jgi:RNA polymerase sigma factor (sigma-70 family)
MMPIDSKLQPFEEFFKLPVILEASVEWRSSSRLHKNISQIISHNEDLSVDELLYIFIREFKAGSTDPLVREHLFAFLSRMGVSRARKMGGDKWPDILQIVLCRISQVDWVLEKFNPNHFSRLRSFSASVLGFAKRFINGIIQDKIRQTDENYNRTDLGMVKHASIKKIREALRHSSYSPEEVEQAVLIKKTLEEYRKAVRHPVTDADYQAIADRCNHILQRSSQINSTSLNANSLRNHFEEIGKAIYKHSKAKTEPLNTWIGDDENSSDEFDYQVYKSGILSDSPDPEKTEEQQNQNKVRILICEKVHELPLDERRVTVLFKGLQIKQNKITEETGIRQYNVSRIYDRAIAKLLKHILPEIQAMYREQFTSYNCEDAEAAIDELLSSSYPQHLNQILLSLSKSITTSSTQQLLELLATKFTDYLQELLHMVFQINGSAHGKIQHLAKEFIAHPSLDDYYPYAA